MSASPASTTKRPSRATPTSGARTRPGAELAAYQSSVSWGTATRNVAFVWMAYGALLTAVAIGTFVTPSARLHEAVRGGWTLLLLLTFVVIGMWVSIARANVPAIGGRPNSGAMGRLVRHLVALVLGGLAFVASSALPDQAEVLQLAGLAFIGVAMAWLPLAAVDVLRMLWYTSVPPRSPSDEPPLGPFLPMAALTVAGLAAPSALDLDATMLAAASVVAGIGCIVAAWTLATIVPAIAQRQDERVVAIVEQTTGGAEGAGPVTGKAIEAEWARSEGLVQLPH